MSTSQFLGKVRRLSQEQIVIGLSLLFFMSVGDWFTSGGLTGRV